MFGSIIIQMDYTGLVTDFFIVIHCLSISLHVSSPELLHGFWNFVLGVCTRSCTVDLILVHITSV